jgi:hypothetical protein
MTVQRLLLATAAALAASMSASHAGPCSQEIDSMQPRVDAMLEASARAGPTAPESPAALLHRQPTSDSIAAAESKLGEASRTVEAAVAAIARAREADRAGDKNACEQALADVRRAVDPALK